ncbi:FN3 associated domain-containing protein [Aquimarina hainanensis]|uniref:FN3 associated domain-containing protein n=1 Tax=Aquimarina hainanensis TaxID=1578017 RepID=A0ABW5N200_9FLAO
MKKNLFFFCLAILMIYCSKKKQPTDTSSSEKIIAIHLLDQTSDEKLEQLSKQLPELATLGVNLLFLEVDYHYDFTSHPELRDPTSVITKSGAQKFKEQCDKNGIRLVPQFQSFGHQSWAETTYSLLTIYPELDLTPGAYPGNKDIYCREWDPYNPRVNQIVFALIDEILEGFNADGLHLGMDEIFLIDSPHAKSTKDKNPAEVFAKVVNDFHDYFATEKKVDLFIWGDRLIDGNIYKYGSWESSLNGTAPAIDLIPKDIIICDWHYEPMETYPSVNMFIDKGFSVLPCSFKKINAVENLIKYSYKNKSPKMLGHLFTTWSFQDAVSTYAPLLKGTSLIQSKKFYDVTYDISLSPTKDTAYIQLKSDLPELTIHYTTDSSTPSTHSKTYTAPIPIYKETTIKALAFEGAQEKGTITSKKINIHKGLAGITTSKSPLTDKYTVLNGIHALHDGIIGSSSFSDGHWAGFDSINMDITISYPIPQKIETIAFHFINDPGNWIYPPVSIEVYSSVDGKDFTKIKTIDIPLRKEKVRYAEIKNLDLSTQYLQIRGINRPIPQDRKNAGKPTWIFIDEIIVR